jgi:hypothetical protein
VFHIRLGSRGERPDGGKVLQSAIDVVHLVEGRSCGYWQSLGHGCRDWIGDPRRWSVAGLASAFRRLLDFELGVTLA